MVFLCVVSLAYSHKSFAQAPQPFAPIAFSSYRVVGHVEDNNSSMMFVETHDPTMAVIVMADSLGQNEEALATSRLEKCRATAFDKMASGLSSQLEATRLAQSQGQKLSEGDLEALRVMPDVMPWLNGMSGQPEYACVLGRRAAKAK